MVLQQPLSPPESESQLLCRAQKLAGLSVATLAKGIDWPVPERLTGHKGWLGDLLEQHLGACAGSTAQPDFPHLGIELKTIPITPQGKPLESTFVSIVPLEALTGVTWEQSDVCAKLRQVLWIPIMGERGEPIAEKIVCSPLLWRPSPQQWQQLQEDWCTLTDMMVLGDIGGLTAHHGTYLQVRPKGANAQERRWGVGPEGAPIRTQPRGFYLRATFTQSLLKTAFFATLER
ncbi:MAG: DNA mismatch repair endonuclease MutH [Gammaproteobacteria bacterium]